MRPGARTVTTLRSRLGDYDRKPLVRRWVDETMGSAARGHLVGDAAVRVALRRVGASVRVDNDLAYCGELRVVEDKFVIVHAGGLSDSRLRFTIAHELGHASLHRIDPSLDQDNDLTERLCDQFAAELLMPSVYFLSAARTDSYARLVLMAAGRAGASLRSACIRVTDCLGGAAGIAARDGTIEFECGNSFVVDAMHYLRVLAMRERVNFFTQEVEDRWLLDVGCTGSKFIYVVRSIKQGHRRTGRLTLPRPAAGHEG